MIWLKSPLFNLLAQASKVKEDEDADSGNHFTPQFYSVPLHDFAGSAKQSTDISSQVHVARQSKGRMEKKDLAERLNLQIIIMHLSEPSTEHTNSHFPPSTSSS